MNRILHSIPLKICFTILITEALFLLLMGSFYINRFWNEIDNNISEKLSLPAILMEQRALNFDAVTDYSAMEEIVQQEVLDAFITKNDGTIYYSKDPTRIGQNHTLYLDQQDPASSGIEDPADIIQTLFPSGTNKDFRSILAPLTINDRLLGTLYIKINAKNIQQQKNEILYLFLFGSVLTIILTTISQALLIHRIFVPRIKKTSSVLKKVEGGNLTARVSQPGTPDQLGLLIEQVNSMLTQIELNTDNLRLLNTAGESISEARGRKEIQQVSIDILEKHTDQPLPAHASGTLQEIIDSSVEKDDIERKIFRFTKTITGYLKGSPSAEFSQTLSRLISNAVNRENLLEHTKKAEEQYRDLFTSAQEGIFRTTPSGRLLTANPSLFIMFGYDTSLELDLLPDDIISQHYVNLEDRFQALKILAREGEIRDFETQFRHKNGSIFWASISSQCLKGKDGQIESIKGRIVDISERKKREKAERDKEIAEATSSAQIELLEKLENNNSKLTATLEELKRTQKQLVQSEKMTAVGMTASGVAHDLNNILSGVIGYPELLLLKLDEESEMRKPLEAIMAAGKRAADVVADLLTLSRDVARTMEVVSLNDLVDEYLNSVECEQLKTTFPDISLTSDLDTSLPPIYCSTTHILKVIMNLLINAFEAMKSSGHVLIVTECKTISAVSSFELAAGDYVVLRVIDNGPGIDDEDLQHVFDPFYTKKVMGQSGTGLGLTVVKNAIEEHKGTVQAMNRKKGTEFSVYLPVTEKKSTVALQGTAYSDMQGKGSILVVDDEEVQRDVASQMLTQLGYTVETVSSGEKALQYLARESADLILLDMLMPPGLNGRQTFERINNLHPGQKAILVSGFSEHREVKRALELGVNGFLKKPYTLAQLWQTVQDGLMQIGPTA